MKSTLVVLAFIILSVDASGYYDLHAGDSTYWCEGCEGPAMADTLLNFQRPSGGWPKNVDPTPGDVYWGKEYSATLDNDATVGEIRFMAQAYKETGVADYVESAEKGLDFIFDSQYPTGGWPQTYPGASSYKAHITFNDNLHVNVLRLLDEVAAQMSPFDILPFTEIATQAKSAVKMGLKCLVDTQIHVPDTAGGMCPTTRRNWCAQHDRNTLEPMPGRDYEPVSFSGREGINIAHYLMSLDNPSADIKEAIVGAYIWAKTAVLMNYSVELDKNNNRILAYHKGAQLWPRFATIPDSEAIFCDRGCVDNPSLEHNQYPEGFASINAERRNGYYWLGNWGANIVQRFEEEWSVDHQVTINPSCVGLTFSPTLSQTSSPTRNPTASPTSRPTLNPTASPTPRPSVHPTSSPTSSPSFQPTTVPTASPTLAPTLQPTDAPTRNPTLQPTGAPTASPTASPSLILTENAGASPAPNLAASSTSNPTASPTPSPTSQPNDSPTINPMQSLSLEEAPAALPFTEDEGKGAFSYQPSPRPFPVPTAVYTPNTPIAPSPSAPSLFSPSTPIASPAAPFSLTNREVKVATSTSGVNTTCGTDALPSDVESQVQQVIEWEFGVCLSESDIDTVAGKILVALNTDLVDTFLDCQFDDTWNVKGIYMPSEIPQCTTDSSTGGNCYLCNHEFVVAVLRRAESMGEQAVHTNLTDIISTIGGFLNEFDPELPEIESLSVGGVDNTSVIAIAMIAMAIIAACVSLAGLFTCGCVFKFMRPKSLDRTKEVSICNNSLSTSEGSDDFADELSVSCLEKFNVEVKLSDFIENKRDGTQSWDTWDGFAEMEQPTSPFDDAPSLQPLNPSHATGKVTTIYAKAPKHGKGSSQANWRTSNNGAHFGERSWQAKEDGSRRNHYNDRCDDAFGI